MGLQQRFNLALGVVLLVGLLISGYLTYITEFRQADKDVLDKATMLMEMARYTRLYTNENVTPLLRENLDMEFQSASVPAYAAHRIFDLLKQTYPEYTYGQRVLHPTNPHDRAVGWEVEIINRFIQDKNLKDLVGIRQGDKGEIFYRATPITVKSESCLICHGNPDDAPESMLEIYGRLNGFNWKLNEIIGMQIVTVPTKPAHNKAWNSLLIFFISASFISLILFFTINTLLHRLVTKPLKELSHISVKSSLEILSTDELEKESIQKNIREIKTLHHSISRLRHSLYHALRLIDGRKLLNSNSSKNDNDDKVQ